MNCKEIYLRDAVETSLKTLYAVYKQLDYTSLEDLRKELSMFKDRIETQQFEIKCNARIKGDK